MSLLDFHLHMSAQRVHRTIGTIGGSGSWTRVAQATRSAFDQVYVRDIQGHSQVPTVVVRCRSSASPPSMTSFVCAPSKRAEWQYMTQVTLSLPLLYTS